MTSILLSLALLSAGTSDTVQSPNVVLILADDLGWGDVGFNGRKEWSTPYLDALAREGTVYKRWYTGAVVCAPSRGVLLTGKSTIHCGVSRNNDDLPAEELTIAEALKGRGYKTALFGKWHHGAPRKAGADYVHPMDQGFDEFFGFTDAKHAWQKQPTELWEGRELKPSQGWANDLFTDRGIEFVRRNKKLPFFLYLPLTDPHFDVEAPPDALASLSRKFPGPASHTHYAAMITRMDRNVGRILKAIDEEGLTSKTLMIFVSDHGATFEGGNKGASDFHDSNYPFRGQKRTLWEGGIRVPAIVRWPGQVRAGAISQAVVHHADIMPTLLAATGTSLGPENKFDGSNMLDVLRGKSTSPERTLFWEWRSEGMTQLAAMRGDLKLVVTGNNGPELFNVERDPAERRNIAASYPQVVQSLQKELKVWLATEKKSQ